MSKVPPPDPFVNFYHPNSPEVKRLDTRMEDFVTREAALKQQGWGRSRFAQMLYHPKLGQKLARSPQEVLTMKKAGWLDKPITDPKDAADAHPDAVHAHHNDPHRAAYLETQKQNQPLK